MAINDAHEGAGRPERRPHARSRQLGPWTVYEVADAPLVEGLANEPAVLSGADDRPARPWQDTAVCWYVDADELGRAARPGRSGRLAAGHPHRHAGSEATPAAVRAVEDWGWFAETAAPRSAAGPVEVTNVVTGTDTISFDVDEPGVPVLVKMSYFPNWKVSGAEGPYRVTPELHGRRARRHPRRAARTATPPIDYLGYLRHARSASPGSCTCSGPARSRSPRPRRFWGKAERPDLYPSHGAGPALRRSTSSSRATPPSARRHRPRAIRGRRARRRRSPTVREPRPCRATDAGTVASPATARCRPRPWPSRRPTPTRSTGPIADPPSGPTREPDADRAPAAADGAGPTRPGGPADRDTTAGDRERSAAVAPPARRVGARSSPPARRATTRSAPTSTVAATAPRRPATCRLSVVVPAFREERIGDDRRPPARRPGRGRRATAASRSSSSTTAPATAPPSGPSSPGPTRSSASRSTGARARRCGPACSRRSGPHASPSPTPTCPTRPTSSSGCCERGRGGLGRRRRQPPPRRHHHAGAGRPPARDRRPGHQPAHPRRAARPVPRHPVRAQGVPLRRRPG